MKYSVISSFLSKTKDRFHEYNKELSLEEKFMMASRIKGMSAMECVYPYEVSSPEETVSLMKKYNLGISAVNVNIKAEPEFRMGGITSSNKDVREKAISFMKKGKDFAKAIGVNQIQVCPLGDGYEFAFQADYHRNWEYLKVLPNAAKTILLIEQIGKSGLGVTLDFGHSVYGGNNPAEELSLLHSCGIPYYIHINDNDGKWDWDYFAGCKHVIEYLEFLYYLKKFNYEGYLVSDTSPTRTDIIETFEANNRMTDRLLKVVDTLDVESLQGNSDYMEIWKIIEANLFK